MKTPIYQLDAFTDTLFRGNPAAVVPLAEWLSDETLQKIACENMVPETAYYVRNENGYEIRWFTPVTEVDLCGHATLAAAYVVFREEAREAGEISFGSRSGILNVTKEDDGWLTLDFPVDTYQVAVPPPALQEAISAVTAVGVYRGKADYMVVLETEEELRELKPDIIVLSTVPTRGIIVTAPGEETDFVSRFFAPQSGIDEDPVTGSAHTTLVPYWAKQLGKTELTAKQISQRGGYLRCRLNGERVLISGQVKEYMRGEIEIE
ncbi:MAG: isomerase [Cytophagaceae bacterium SCN 52-12]|nr:MAG: isomerase [Cytophagaceae bacterium SCN 52-12]